MFRLKKIERYRKVIALAPGSPESLKFMRLIMLSKRGPTADMERVTELEKFITEFPLSANSARALGMLRETYRRINDHNPDARIAKLMQAVKVSDAVRQAVDASVRVWVYPDPQKQPQSIVLQFSNGDFNYGVQRAYWGTAASQWGKDGTLTMKRMGDMPKPGQWTELRVSPFDLDLDNLEIKVIALSSIGGLTNSIA